MDRGEQLDKLAAVKKFRELAKSNKHEYVKHISEILKPMKPQSLTPQNSIQKALVELNKQFFKYAVPIRCPNCDARSPRIRKDGATKFFQMPLSDKDKRAMIDTHKRTSSRIIYEELEASTYDSDSDDTEMTENTRAKAKFLHPFEVQEHIKRMWEVNDDVMSLMFGNLDAQGRTVTNGY